MSIDRITDDALPLGQNSEDYAGTPETERGRQGTCVIQKQGRQEDRQDAREATHFAAHDFIAGCAAGAASTATGHPFDTVKIRVQLSK